MADRCRRMASCGIGNLLLNRAVLQEYVPLLTAATNELLTRIGPGTPMGELLRRYWQPIGGASELDANPIKPIRLMGENLVLYRDKSGRYGLVDRHCSHRRADLSYG